MANPEKKELKSRLLSVMFADVQGFTRKTANQTREDNQRFIQEIQGFVSEYLDKWKGKLIKTMGDGFLATFESPSNAVQCGLEMQRRLESRNASVLNPDNFIRFRIGINSGEVSLDDNGDIYGDVVNIAARIESFAEPNEVFISEATYLAMNANEVGTIDLGPQQFKNATREVRVYKICKNPAVRGKQIPAATRSAPSSLQAFLQSPLAKVCAGVGIFLLGFGLAYRMLKPRHRKGSPPETTVSQPAQPAQPAQPSQPAQIGNAQPPLPQHPGQPPVGIPGGPPGPGQPPPPFPGMPLAPIQIVFPTQVPHQEYLGWVFSLPPELQRGFADLENAAAQGDFKAATAIQNKLYGVFEQLRIEQIPISVFVRFGEIQLGAGNQKEAKEEFDRALQLNRMTGKPVPDLKERVARTMLEFRRQRRKK